MNLLSQIKDKRIKRFNFERYYNWLFGWIAKVWRNKPCTAGFCQDCLIIETWDHSKTLMSDLPKYSGLNTQFTNQILRINVKIKMLESKWNVKNGEGEGED